LDAATIERYADLIVEVGANVQPGQDVLVSGHVGGDEDFVRAVAASAYRRGARFVDAAYFDPWVKRARIEHAADDTLEYVPPWIGARITQAAEAGGAHILITSPVTPGFLEGLDPARAGRDLLPYVKEVHETINARSTNWCACVYPTPGWAKQVHAELDGGAALRRLWEQVTHVCRLDEADPLEAWRARVDELDIAAQRLTERRFDALHFEGPGTELTVGLFRSSRWWSAKLSRRDGLPHLANLPSEEIFTSPDAARVHGFVRATRPLQLSGNVVEDFMVRFENGRAVAFEGKNAAVLEARAQADEGAARLGEIALVDRSGRIGPLRTTFYETLLDENSASHVALGNGFDFAIEDDAERERKNRSAIHVDFMIGGEDVDVTGVTQDGERVPVLRGGDWQI
jgi:aminopeptidase